MGAVEVVAEVSRQSPVVGYRSDPIRNERARMERAWNWSQRRWRRPALRSSRLPHRREGLGLGQTRRRIIKISRTDLGKTEWHRIPEGRSRKMPEKPSDMTSVVDLTCRKGTGPVRTERPVYVDLLPPCNHACPAGEDIQG